MRLYRDGSSACLFPGDFGTMTTGADGAFSKTLSGADTKNASDEARCFRAALPPSTDQGNVSQDFLMQVTDVQAPPMRRWSGHVQVTPTATGATVAFQSIAQTHGFTAPEHTLTVEGSDGAAFWKASKVASGYALTDEMLEDFADTTVALSVFNEVKGSGTTFGARYASQHVAVSGHGKVPVSRGADCSFGDTACKLTDGSIKGQTMPYPAVNEARVTLATAKVLKKAVVRGIAFVSTFHTVTIEGSADGTTFVTLGSVSDADAISAGFVEIPLSSGTAVSVVRVRMLDSANQPVGLGAIEEVSLFE